MAWTDITTALANVWDLVGDSIDFMKDNVVLMAVLAAGLVPIGFRIFKKAKRAVK